MNVEFNPSIKQDEFFDTFEDDNLSEVLYGGGAGGGKSYILWGLIIIKCLEYPGIRVGLGRNTLVEIKKNTMTSFFEVVTNLKVPEDYYKYNPIDGKIKFKNGSEIIFYELRYLPSDPNYDRFGGALLTFGAIEEAGNCSEKGKSILQSRLGRWKNDEYSIKPKLFMTCNPSRNFLYSDFYRPYQKGELEPFRKFIPAVVSDNPYIGKDYEDNLRMTLTEEARLRLLQGEWDFDDDKSRLLKYEEVLEIYNGNDLDNGVYYLSADIAFSSDKCIILLWQGLTVKKVIHYTGDSPEQEIIRLRDKYNIAPRNIVYDADGVGHYLKGKIRQAYAFVNNSQPIKVQNSKQNFDHLKSQVYWKLAEKIKDGSVKVADNNLKEELIQELYEIKSQPLETLDGKLKLIKKKDVKDIIGRSPDISDAMAYRMVFEIKGKARRPF